MRMPSHRGRLVSLRVRHSHFMTFKSRMQAARAARMAEAYRWRREVLVMQPSLFGFVKARTHSGQS